MNLDNPAVLFSGLVLGAIGMGMFIYGKKQQRLDCLAVGAVLGVLPMVAHSMLVIWGVAAVCLGGMYAKSRVG